MELLITQNCVNIVSYMWYNFTAFDSYSLVPRPTEHKSIQCLIHLVSQALTQGDPLNPLSTPRNSWVVKQETIWLYRLTPCGECGPWDYDILLVVIQAGALLGLIPRPNQLQHRSLPVSCVRRRIWWFFVIYPCQMECSITRCGVRCTWTNLPTRRPWFTVMVCVLCLPSVPQAAMGGDFTAHHLHVC